MLILTSNGLYCRKGDFYIDPRRGVDHAVITHAHSDHARSGSLQYYTASSGVSVLKARLGQKISVLGKPYGEEFKINGVKLSFHPAGHILGSSQVRIESAGQVWVASGDYKRDADPTCEAFEVVPCDVFVTEATFGTPRFCWQKDAQPGREIFEWWMGNSLRGINSVLFAYSLGKAQRILGLLAEEMEKENVSRSIICHPAASVLNDCYRKEGVRLAPTRCLSSVQNHERLQGELLLVPQSFLESTQSSVIGQNFETAFASGWMVNQTSSWKTGGYDRGFVISDHADWNDLLKTIEQTKAKRVYVQHRGKGALVRHLRAKGLEAFADTELIPTDPDQLDLF